jgi:hypothetical protein
MASQRTAEHVLHRPRPIQQRGQIDPVSIAIS